MIRLPRLQSLAPIVDKDGKPTLTFTRYFQAFAEQIELFVNKIAEILGITAQLDAAIAAANAAAAAAKLAADAAKDVADDAQTSTDAQKREAALQTSYIDPDTVLTASLTTITIAAHTRRYSDGTSATVSAGTIAATGEGDVDYVFYDDPARAGGAVTYQVATVQPIQTGDRHVVEAIMIPATGTSEGGGGPRPPGYVLDKFSTE
jgi:hypothetical protein